MSHNQICSACQWYTSHLQAKLIPFVHHVNRYICDTYMHVYTYMIVYDSGTSHFKRNMCVLRVLPRVLCFRAHIGVSLHFFLCSLWVSSIFLNHIYVFILLPITTIIPERERVITPHVVLRVSQTSQCSRYRVWIKQHDVSSLWSLFLTVAFAPVRVSLVQQLIVIAMNMKISSQFYLTGFRFFQML